MGTMEHHRWIIEFHIFGHEVLGPDLTEILHDGGYEGGILRQLHSADVRIGIQ